MEKKGHDNKRLSIGWYVFADTIAASFAWLSFYLLRTQIYNYNMNVGRGFFFGLLLFVCGWLMLHLLSGAYDSLYKKSRMYEVLKTALVSLIGSLIILFFYILNNPPITEFQYSKQFLATIIPIFFFTVIFRIPILNYVKRQIENGVVSFKTLLVGSGNNAREFYRNFSNAEQKSGFMIDSFLNMNGFAADFLPDSIPQFEKGVSIGKLVEERDINEVVIATNLEDRNAIHTLSLIHI